MYLGGWGRVMEKGGMKEVRDVGDGSRLRFEDRKKGHVSFFFTDG